MRNINLLTTLSGAPFQPQSQKETIAVATRGATQVFSQKIDIDFNQIKQCTWMFKQLKTITSHDAIQYFIETEDIVPAEGSIYYKKQYDEQSKNYIYNKVSTFTLDEKINHLIFEESVSPTADFQFNADFDFVEHENIKYIVFVWQSSESKHFKPTYEQNYIDSELTIEYDNAGKIETKIIKQPKLNLLSSIYGEL